MKQLAATVAHELNNALTGIFGNLSLLSEVQATDPVSSRECLEGAINAADRAASIVEELEAFSSRLRLRPDTIEINRALSDIRWKGLGGSLSSLDVVLRTAKTSRFVLADPDYLKRAIKGAIAGLAASMTGGAQQVRFEVMNESKNPGCQSVCFDIFCRGLGFDPHRIIEALQRPSLKPGAGDPDAWGLAAIAGFFHQSGGELSLAPGSTESPALRLCLPASELRNTETSPRRISGPPGRSPITAR